jgi:hypothetical protein
VQTHANVSAVGPDVSKKLADAEERCRHLEDALQKLQNGPTADLMQAWEGERGEMLAQLEEAEDKILRMSTQARTDSRAFDVRRSMCAHNGKAREVQCSRSWRKL